METQGKTTVSVTGTTDQFLVYLEGLTAGDFDTEEPYKYLFQQHFSNFDLRKALKAMIAYAKRLGLKESDIKGNWRAFLDDRKPAQIVGYGDAFTDFPEQETVVGGKSILCGKYLCDCNGIGFVGPKGEWVQVLAHPLMPIKRIVDVESGFENLQIAFCRIKQDEKDTKVCWKEIITPRETTASAQRIIGLAKNGIAINSENAKDVVKYISDIENLNYSNLDTQLSCSHMGWLQDGQFIPYTKDITFDGGTSEEFEKLYNGFQEHGKEQTWMELAKTVRAGQSVPARIALAASFAAPLVHKCGALSFFVHLWGDKGTGKSVALMLGASVWCNPVIGDYIKSFSATKVSQELFASFCCNLPVFMDELQVVADRRLFDDIIYSLCEGVSKGRGTKDGGLQRSKRWETVFITTGEMPIVQSNSQGGATVRTIEVDFGGEPFFTDARTVANTLKKNYGFAGKKYIEAIQKMDPDELNKKQKEFADQLTDVQDKQSLAASIILLADWLAEQVLFQDGKALTAEEIKQYLVSKSESDSNEKLYRYVVDWVNQNQEQFDEDSEYRRGLWGVIGEEKGRKVVYCFKEVLENYIGSKNLSYNAFIDWADRKNILVRDRVSNDNERRKTKKKRLKAGRTFNSIALYLPFEDEDIPKIRTFEDDFVEIEGEKLPFMD